MFKTPPFLSFPPVPSRLKLWKHDKFSHGDICLTYKTSVFQVAFSGDVAPLSIALKQGWNNEKCKGKKVCVNPVFCGMIQKLSTLEFNCFHKTFEEKKK